MRLLTSVQPPQCGHTHCRLPVHTGRGWGGGPAVPGGGLAHVQDDRKASGLNGVLSRWPVPPPPSPRSYRARPGPPAVTWGPDQSGCVTYCPTEAHYSPGGGCSTQTAWGEGLRPPLQQTHTATLTGDPTPADPHSEDLRVRSQISSGPGTRPLISIQHVSDFRNSRKFPSRAVSAESPVCGSSENKLPWLRVGRQVPHWFCAPPLPAAFPGLPAAVSAGAQAHCEVPSGRTNSFSGSG